MSVQSYSGIAFSPSMGLCPPSGEQGAMPEWGLDVHGDALPWTERLVV